MKHLLINLRNKSFSYENNTGKGIGGLGSALRVFQRKVDYSLEAYHPDQPVVFASGPLSGLFPAATKIVSVFRSPHTGNLGESYAGGKAALVMGNLGLSTIAIIGKSAHPIILEINEDEVSLKNATPFWGQHPVNFINTSSRVSMTSVMVIGPAGENLVTYGNVTVDNYRHFGRLGLGAALGSKNIKAIILKTKGRVKRVVSQDYLKLYESIYLKVIEKGGPMEKYRNMGTVANLLPLNEMGGLPCYNLQRNNYEYAPRLSGEAFASGLLVRKLSCGGCPLGCIHLGLYRGGTTGNHDYFGELIPYDHEPVYAVGSLLGMKSAQQVLALIRKIEQMGLDVITTGVVLAWATEAFKKGLLSHEMLQTSLQFGEVEGYLEAIAKIVSQSTPIYKDMAKGVTHAANIYGGEDFALALSGQEVAGYHTGYGNILGQLCGGRHSHLDNAGYTMDQEIKPTELMDMPDKLVQEEKIRGVLNSLVVCLFARKIYDMEIVEKALASIGYDFNQSALSREGEDIYRLKWQIKKNLGFSPEKLQVPARFFATETPWGKLDAELFNNMHNIYLSSIKGG